MKWGERDKKPNPSVEPNPSVDGGLPTLSVKSKAADNNAAVTLALWEDYQKNYTPYQYQMLDSLTTENPAIVGQSVAEAQGLVGQNFDVAKRNQQVSMARLGMAPDMQTRQSFDRSSSLEKAAAMAGAANTTRAGLKERDNLIMIGGVPNVANRSYGMSGE